MSGGNAVTRAADIRDTTVTNHNSASRVGELLYDLARATEFNVEAYGASPSATGAANDAAIALAIADAVAAGGSLYWPAGTFTSAASIASLHSVKHRGPGALRRGTDTFYLDPKYGQTNTLYVNGSGSASNDGLTASQPMAQPQDAFDAMTNYGPVLHGSWVVSQAAGALTNKPVAVLNLKSRNRILWKGPAAAYGTPTAIMDGTGAAADGANFYATDVQVQDIKFQNWTSTNCSGLVFLNDCDAYCVNVHAATCDFLGIGGTGGELYVEGGVVSGCTYGIRAYSQCKFNIGYNGHAPSVTTCSGAGINLRDCSSGDLIGITSSNNTGIGVYILHQSRVRMVNCTVQNNGTTGVQATIFSTYDNQSGNTVSGNPNGNWVNQWSVPLGAQTEYIYDDTNVRHGWGTVNPSVKYHFRKTAGSTAYSASAMMALEDVSPVLSFSADNTAGTSFAGFYFAKAASSSHGQFFYNYADDSFRLAQGGANRWRINTTSITAEVDNTSDLGSSALRFRQTWAVTRFYSAGVFDSAGSGTPEGVVAASVGSTYRRTNGGAGTSFYVKESGSGNTGWVAK